MFKNHVLETFKLPNETTVLEKLYGFSLVNNDDIMIKESAATGFDCGVPAEPSVRKYYVYKYYSILHYSTTHHPALKLIHMKDPDVPRQLWNKW